MDYWKRCNCAALRLERVTNKEIKKRRIKIDKRAMDEIEKRLLK